MKFTLLLLLLIIVLIALTFKNTRYRKNKNCTDKAQITTRQDVVSPNSDKPNVSTFAHKELENSVKKNNESASISVLNNPQEKRFVCAYRQENTFHIYFMDDGRKPSRILHEYCKSQARSLSYLPNVFDDDETVNIHATFESSAKHEEFIWHCLKLGEPLGADPSHLFGIQGYAIYGIPINDFRNGFSGLSPRKGLSVFVVGNIKSVLKLLYERFGEPYNGSNLPIGLVKFCEEKLAMRQVNKEEESDYYTELKKNLLKMRTFPSRERYQTWKKNVWDKNKEDLKNQYNEIYLKILSSGEINPKWKSEYNLYTIAKSLYPDAVYQYRAPWLGAQSLDIYIPSIATGIEYQGQQHYQAVEIFGGQKGLQHRIELDAKKKELCRQNEIKLIEIRYDEPINAKYLQERISKKF